MGLYQLLYQSVAQVPFNTEALTELLHEFCAYNLAHEVTGLLLHTPDGRFLQVLEGEYEVIRHLYYNRIALDPRHFNLRVFSEGPCHERAFAQWSMGFRVARAQDLRTLLGCVPPDIPGLMVPRPRTRPELMALLHKFIAECDTAPEVEHPWMSTAGRLD